MGYNADDEDEGDGFTVTVKGEEFVLPQLGSLSLDQIEVLADLDLTGGLPEVRRIFGTLNPDFAARGIGGMSATKLRKMMDAWQKDSGVTLGESPASEGSSEASTAPRSKPTSSRKASAPAK